MRAYVSYQFLIVLLVFFVSTLLSCEKDLPPNPFDKEDIVDSTNLAILNPKRIEGLHQNVFKPTCANSGCHDGTFEPDFRTIESTYNSLVYQDVIKQNPSNPVDYRVLPGNSNQSMIVQRVTIDLGGNSGIMPLVVDPSSDWNEKSADYIQDLKDWINDGAKDIFGNPSQSVNLKPQLVGSAITATGSTIPFTRNIEGVIEIPQGTASIDIYIAIEDKETAPANIVSAYVELSLSADDFTNALKDTFIFQPPLNFIGYSGLTTPFYHKISIANPYGIWAQNSIVFMNVSINDGDNTPSNSPGLYALEHLKKYYAFRLK